MTTSTDRRQGVNSSAAIKVACRAATTANITLSGEQTIDDIAIVADDRVLVKNQTDASENGIYDADTSAWSRALDWDGNIDIASGTQVLVVSGTVAAGKLYYISTTGDLVVGTTNITITAVP